MHPASHRTDDGLSGSSEPTQRRPGALSWLVLVGGVALIVLLRWHARTEPLDCDEAAYAYVAKRLLAGDRLYADVFENKPPAAYLIFAAAIALGGYEELTIRLASLPFVLVTMFLVWLVARQIAGDAAGAAAAALFAIVSHDPFLFGETANLEAFMNPFLVASLYAALRASNHAAPIWPLAAGLSLGMASVIKQVVIPHALLMVLLLASSGRQRRGRLWTGLLWRQLGLWVAGCTIPWISVLSFCAWQRVVPEFLHTLFIYGPALTAESARHTAWERLGRLVIGNPEVPWWGHGTWPLVALAMIAVYSCRPDRRPRLWLLLAWTGATFIAIYLPGLFWQHYYLLAIPPLAILAACTLSAGVSETRAIARLSDLNRAALRSAGWSVCLLSLVVWQCRLQYVHYWSLSPEEIVRKHKDGNQWLIARELGRMIGRAVGPSERMYVWGYESPLHFYSRMDSVSPYFFLDPLIRKYPEADLPLLAPRLERITHDLATEQPAIVFTGDRPPEQIVRVLRNGYQAVAVVPVPGKTIVIVVRRDWVSEILALGTEADD